MTFDYPAFLIAFLIFVPIIFFDIFKISGKYKHKLPKELEKKLKVSVFLFRSFIVFAIIAMSGPRWGTGFTAGEYRRGLDTVFAIDVSRSMDIRDVQISGVQVLSRLDRGLSIARESVFSVSGARFAAAIGRGRGLLAVPLTWDSEASLSFLESLDGSSMTGRSTNLESLVESAADAFQSTSAARKVIVLFSDGESHAGVLANALNRCIREGVIINAVALGSDEGRPVPEDPNNTQALPAISRRDAAVMRTAAEKTGGIYIDGSREDAAFVLSNHLLSLSVETGQRNSRSETKERRTLFIILALIAYGASKFYPLLPRLPLFSIAAFLFLSSCSEGKLLLMEANYLNSRGRYDEAIVPYQKALNYEDAAPYAEYGLGLTFHSLDESKAALTRYGNSQKMLENILTGEHRELRYRNKYNSGIVLFEEGDFHSAAAAFKDALRTDPRKIEAKRNLELSLLSIERANDKENQNDTQQENKTREILFEYLRQQEQQKWKSREWTPEEKQAGPDY